MGQRVLCFSKNIYEFQSLKQAWQFETVQNVVRSLKSSMIVYKYLSMFSWRSANWLIGSPNIIVIVKYWSLEKYLVPSPVQSCNLIFSVNLAQFTILKMLNKLSLHADKIWTTRFNTTLKPISVTHQPPDIQTLSCQWLELKTNVREVFIITCWKVFIITCWKCLLGLLH